MARNNYGSLFKDVISKSVRANQYGPTLKTVSSGSLVTFQYLFAKNDVYPLVIFIHSHLNRKVLHYKDWRDGILISIGMIVLPLLTLNLFFGVAIPETIHIIFVIIWNLKIAFK